MEEYPYPQEFGVPGSLTSSKEYNLCRAVYEGDVDIVAELLAQGQDPNSASRYEDDLRYMTALERAVDNLHIQLVALLYIRGADPSNNTYDGDELDPKSCLMGPYGYVREGFNSDGQPIPGFRGLHALLVRLQDKPRYHQMKAILLFMEACQKRVWPPQLTPHLRVGLGISMTSQIFNKVFCVLLCFQKVLLAPMPKKVSKYIYEFVILDCVQICLQAIADGEKIGPTAEGHTYNVPLVDPFHTSEVKTPTSIVDVAAQPVLDDIHHIEPAMYIDPHEAALVNAELETGYIEAVIHSPGLTDASQDDANTDDAGTLDEPMSYDDHGEIAHLVRLNFTRHPVSFEVALQIDETLRELRESICRAGFKMRLPSGAWVLVEPQHFPTVKRAIVGRTLCASDVIVTERWEPVVMAAVRAGTSHRENVRVRNVETLAYSGSDTQVIVERTFLSVPSLVRNSASITHSTASAHGVANPRRCAN